MRTPKSAIYWLKATNGSGKSTLPHHMLNASDDSEIAYIYSKEESKKPKIIATIFKRYGMASIGPYVKGKTFGGCDSLNKTQIEEALDALAGTEYDVFVEGILTGAGTLGTGKPKTGSSYYDILKTYPRKTRAYVFIDSEWENVINRIKARTGKSDEDIDALKGVRSKYDACLKHKDVYKNLGEVDIIEVRNDGSIEEFVQKMMEL